MISLVIVDVTSGAAEARAGLSPYGFHQGTELTVSSIITVDLLYALQNGTDVLLAHSRRLGS